MNEGGIKENHVLDGASRFRAFGILSLYLLASGCAAPAIIADLEHDKVIVQSNGYTSQDDILVEAQRGCAIHKRTAVPISTRTSGEAFNVVQMHLFACKEFSER